MDEELEPLMNIKLPKVSTPEVRALARWCCDRASKGRFPVFNIWLATILDAELDRRENGGEPGMIALPQWNHRELGEALAGAFVLDRSPMTEALGEFVGEVMKFVLCDAAERLVSAQEIGEVLSHE